MRREEVARYAQSQPMGLPVAGWPSLLLGLASPCAAGPGEESAHDPARVLLDFSSSRDSNSCDSCEQAALHLADVFMHSLSPRIGCFCEQTALPLTDVLMHALWPCIACSCDEA